MKDMKRNIIFGLTVLAALLTSCINESLDPCPKGVSMRFVFDYNMEYADAFQEQVDCLTLYIYDKDGNYVRTITENSDVLKEEDYRMVIDLPEGDYRFVAYGGITCEKRSFSPVAEPAEGSKLDKLNVAMKKEGNTLGIQLHDFFWGTLDVTVQGELYRDMTLYMKRNTNNLRIVIQQADTSSDPLDINDFTISITDDNYLFAADNTLITGGEKLIYTPWTSGDGLVTGKTGDGTKVSVAFAEFSISRLMTTNEPRLVIYSHQQEENVVDIPLIRYLLLLKSEKYSGMGDQEYLDRENLWSIIFLLNDYTWHDVQIVINDWKVKKDNIELK